MSQPTQRIGIDLEIEGQFPSVAAAETWLRQMLAEQEVKVNRIFELNDEGKKVREVEVDGQVFKLTTVWNTDRKGKTNPDLGTLIAVHEKDGIEMWVKHGQVYYFYRTTVRPLPKREYRSTIRYVSPEPKQPKSIQKALAKYK